MMEDPINTELILQQEVYCSHKSRGCRKVMALSELEACIEPDYNLIILFLYKENILKLVFFE
jgi:hypothetical protein